MCQRFKSKPAHFVPLNVHMSTFEAVTTTAVTQNSLALASPAVTSCRLCWCFSCISLQPRSGFIIITGTRFRTVIHGLSVNEKTFCWWLERWMSKICRTENQSCCYSLKMTRDCFSFLLTSPGVCETICWGQTTGSCRCLRLCVACQQSQVAYT